VISGTSTSQAGNYPCDPNNNTGAYGLAQVPRLDGQQPYGIATWYEPCTRITGTLYKDGLFPPQQLPAYNPPFIFFDSTTMPDVPGGNMSALLNYSGLAGRNMSMIRHTSVMVMLAEADYVNWVDNGTSNSGFKSPLNGNIEYMPRLGARHGQKSDGGNNAFSNFAFFDGHVALLPTQPFEYYKDSNGQVGAKANTLPLGAVFILSQDQY
jgi:prepilin-type processing-associated H-X9-DG protein